MAEAYKLVCLHEGAKLGDARCRETLAKRLYPAVTTFLQRRLSGDDRLAWLTDDLVQEAMIRIDGGIYSCAFDNDRALIGWCLCVTRNAVIDISRRELPRLVTRLMWHELDAAANQDPACNPTEIDGWVVKTLNEILGALSAESHSLIWRRVVEHASWAEVATELGITPSAAKRRWQRLQTNLRKQIVGRLSPNFIRGKPEWLAQSLGTDAP